MIIFIDESGIERTVGYSVHAIVYITISNIEIVETRLRQTLTEMDMESFHWAEHGWKVKDKFLRKIIKLPFRFKVGIFKNPMPRNEMVETIFQELITEMSIEKVYIDGKQPKWYERKLKKVLRDKGISVKKLKTVRNESSELGLQIADCLAGLIRYHYDKPELPDAKKWVEKLRKEEKLFEEIIL
jgi:hypothetical protein